MLLAAPFVPEGNNVRHATRSFFGSLRVMETEGGAVRFFLHGTTSHGAQRRRYASGSPVRSPVPAQYYHATGPLARGLDVARAATGRATGDFRGAIVGLGIGAMACHKRPGETRRFYEIIRQWSNLRETVPNLLSSRPASPLPTSLSAMHA